MLGDRATEHVVTVVVAIDDDGADELFTTAATLIGVSSVLLVTGELELGVVFVVALLLTAVVVDAVDGLCGVDVDDEATNGGIEIISDLMDDGDLDSGIHKEILEKK